MNSQSSQQTKHVAPCIQLFGDETQAINRNISPIIASIQDYGPAITITRNISSTSTLKRLSLPTLVTTVEPVDMLANTVPQAPKAPESVKASEDKSESNATVNVTQLRTALPKKGRFKLLGTLSLIVILASASYYINSLNSRINLLEQALVGS